LRRQQPPSTSRMVSGERSVTPTVSSYFEGAYCLSSSDPGGPSMRGPAVISVRGRKFVNSRQSLSFLGLTIHDRSGNHIDDQGNDEQHEACSNQLSLALAEGFREVQRDFRRNRCVGPGGDQ